MLQLPVVLEVEQVQRKLVALVIPLTLPHLKEIMAEMGLPIHRLMQQEVVAEQVPQAVAQQTQMLATAVLARHLVFLDHL
jgi:predicted nuclease with RNAse H fold